LYPCFFALQVWGNSYPNNALGIPGSKYCAPEVLRAFNKHCAAVSARAKSAVYMNSKRLLI
jgi:hypothetical protein